MFTTSSVMVKTNFYVCNDNIIIVFYNLSFLWFQPTTTTAAAIGSNKTAAGANHTGDGLLDGSAYNSDQNGKPRFIAVTRLEDVQAVRCAEFHPHGSVYAVGSNSKTLRICAYPKVTDIRSVNLSFSLFQSVPDITRDIVLYYVLRPTDRYIDIYIWITHANLRHALVSIIARLCVLLNKTVEIFILFLYPLLLYLILFTAIQFICIYILREHHSTRAVAKPSPQYRLPLLYTIIIYRYIYYYYRTKFINLISPEWPLLLYCYTGPLIIYIPTHKEIGNNYCNSAFTKVYKNIKYIPNVHFSIIISHRYN